jgi:hypothetical protein
VTGQQRSRVAPELDKSTTRMEVLGLAVGAASSCWSNLEGAGEFDSAEAKRITDDTLEAIQRVDTVPGGTVGVMLQVKAERQRQIERGYTPEHDDEHGLEHIVDQARGRILPQQLRTRGELVQAAACLVAAIEWLDRSDAHLAEYPDDAEPIQD